MKVVEREFSGIDGFVKIWGDLEGFCREIDEES